jgi:hypothetical protein
MVYNPTLTMTPSKEKENYIQVVTGFSRSSSLPAVGTVALKLTTLPTKDFQRF